MKKIALLLMICIGQNLLSQQKPAQYKYLNKLSKDSLIRQTCEQVNRAYFKKGELENACDRIDNYVELAVSALKQSVVNEEFRRLRYKYVPDGQNLRIASERVLDVTTTDLFKREFLRDKEFVQLDLFIRDMAIEETKKEGHKLPDHLFAGSNIGKLYA